VEDVMLRTNDFKLGCTAHFLTLETTPENIGLLQGPVRATSTRLADGRRKVRFEQSVLGTNTWGTSVYQLKSTGQKLRKLGIKPAAVAGLEAGDRYTYTNPLSISNPQPGVLEFLLPAELRPPQQRSARAPALPELPVSTLAEQRAVNQQAEEPAPKHDPLPTQRAEQWRQAGTPVAQPSIAELVRHLNMRAQAEGGTFVVKPDGTLRLRFVVGE
jgi:hypothetical protein